MATADEQRGQRGRGGRRPGVPATAAGVRPVPSGRGEPVPSAGPGWVSQSVSGLVELYSRRRHSYLAGTISPFGSSPLSYEPECPSCPSLEEGTADVAGQGSGPSPPARAQSPASQVRWRVKKRAARHRHRRQNIPSNVATSHVFFHHRSRHPSTVPADSHQYTHMPYSQKFTLQAMDNPSQHLTNTAQLKENMAWMRYQDPQKNELQPTLIK